jgi:hypothetical protein
MIRNGFFYDLKRGFRSISELKQTRPQISVECKDRVISGICFIIDNVVQLRFSV